MVQVFTYIIIIISFKIILTICTFESSIYIIIVSIKFTDIREITRGLYC